MHALYTAPSWRSLPWLVALLLLALATAAPAQEVSDPPGRVAHVTVRDGSVVFAPGGEDEWVGLPHNRPLTAGDRLWTDRGARAELHLGTATLHLDAESQLGLGALDERSAHMLLQQGTVSARVRDLVDGENFEVGTPNLAFRALQPGSYRIDVAPDGSTTRVTVSIGVAAVYGESGQPMHLQAGQQATFAGRALARVQGPQWGQDDFGAWAAERNRLEDASIAARHVPRGVVGYAQLDAHGSWGHDPTYGAVWYPQVVVQDWAPYRYGRWEWISPWGWTWIDDAPWGFAPFHYGRWTTIADRWAWVPGRLPARPVYAPALVVFLGGGNASFGLSLGSGPAVGWYPLAPGEAWWPVYRTTPRYVSFANFNIDLRAYPRHYDRHVWRQRPHAFTAMREDDFRHARPVHRHWRPLQPNAIDAARIGVVPTRPDGRRDRDRHQLPRLHAAPPAAVQPGVQPWGGREWSGRDADRRERAPAVREQFRAEREQHRLQGEAERAARQQQRQAEEQRRLQDGRWQQEQVFRQQQESVRRQQESVRQQQQFRQQQESVRQQQEVLRQQREAARRQHEAVRQQQDAARQHEQARREAWQQERAGREGWRGQEQHRGQREERVRSVDAPRVVAPQSIQGQQAAPLNRGGRWEGRQEPRHEARGGGSGRGQEDRGRGRGRGQRDD